MLDQQFVVFWIGKEEYAVPISQVKEIINYKILTRVPSCDEGILGVVNLRGKIISIIDLGKKIGIESKKEISEQKIVIIENTDGAFGTIVDDVEEVIKISEENINKLSDDLYEENTYLLGIAKKDNRLIIMIDLNLFWEVVFK